MAEKALQLLAPLQNPLVLDVCTGSGAIAIAMGHYKKDAVVYAGDLSAEALQVAAENNRRCHTSVQFRQGNLLEPFADLQGAVDLLVSNPPYVTTQEMAQLPDDVRQEPRLAFGGGADGLYFYRKITAAATTMLKAGGWLLFEIGWQQGRLCSSSCKRQASSKLSYCRIGRDWTALFADKSRSCEKNK